MVRTTLVTVLVLVSHPASAQSAAPELTPSVWQAKYSSERIESLKQRLAAGNRNTDDFWQEVRRAGTPLVEPARPTDKHQLVTLVWRGSPDTRNVLVMINPFTLASPRDYLMTRLADTDVWYLTIRVPHGARFIYQVSPNDPLGAAPTSSAQADPFNRNRWLCAADAPATRCFSMAELPDAAPQPWIAKNPNAKSGIVVQETFRSDLLRNERDVWIYQPPDYTANSAPCALVVLFDGRAYNSIIPTPTILDNLYAAQRIPRTIAVLVGDSDRGRDLIPTSELAASIATELVPWIRARYRVTTDSRQLVIGGSSAGGFVALYTALHHPDVFGNVLSQSGAYFRSPDFRNYAANRAPAAVLGDRDRHDLEELMDRGVAETTGWLAKEVIDSQRLSLRFYLDAGLFEIDLTGSSIGILESTRHMRDVLLAKGYEVHYQTFVGGHDYVNWRGTLADGLVALIGK
jgi:enterochelin esterase family protein